MSQHQKYLSTIYNQFVDIEQKHLKRESKLVDQTEVLVLYTRHQFLRELQNIMNNDESKTLKF